MKTIKETNTNTVYLFKDSPKIAKIGFSGDRWWKSEGTDLSNYRGASYCTSRSSVNLLGELKAPKRIETELHNLFKKLHIRGEYYIYDDEMLNIFNNGFYFNGTTYKPFINNYQEIHKQTSTFDLMKNINFKRPDISDCTIANKIKKLLGINKIEYRYINNTYNDWYPSMINGTYSLFEEFPKDYNSKIYYNYLQFNEDGSTKSLTVFHAPEKNKKVLFDYCDEFINDDIFPMEFKYWSEMALNGFIPGNLFELYDILMNFAFDKEIKTNYRYDNLEGINLYNLWKYDRDYD